LLIDDAVHRFPESGAAATFARAKDTVVGGEDVRFDAGVVDFFESMAGATDEGKKAELHFHGADGREIDFPEIEIFVEEGDAVSVLAGLLAQVADHADFGFLVSFGPAKDELLLRREFVAGENAGAMKAEEDSGGGLGEDAAIQIAADEEDGDMFGDAATATHNLWWQERGQRGGEAGQLSTQGRNKDRTKRL
jgi:hypothetical protein